MRSIILKCLLLLVLLGIFFSGWINAHSSVTHFSDEDLKWVRAYELGDSYIFISNLHNKDRLRVVNTFFDNAHDPHFSESVKYISYAGLTCVITSNRDVDMRNRIIFDLTIEKSAADTLYASLTFGGRFTQKDRVLTATNMQLYPRSFSINGRTFHNCIVSDSTNSGYDPMYIDNYPNHIQEFVWSKEYGLIYYKYDDGEYFVRKDLLE